MNCEILTIIIAKFFGRFLWTLNLYLNETFYNILYFFGGQKWGDIMFHGYHHREMLYIIGYLLHNGGLAWNKKVMGFLSIFVFLLSLETLILFALTLPLLLLLSFFFPPLVGFAQNSTLQGVCACGT